MESSQSQISDNNKFEEEKKEESVNPEVDNHDDENDSESELVKADLKCMHCEKQFTIGMAIHRLRECLLPDCLRESCIGSGVECIGCGKDDFFKDVAMQEALEENIRCKTEPRVCTKHNNMTTDICVDC